MRDICKGGRSANKFRKSQIRKFADPIIFCGLKFVANLPMHSFLFTNISLKFSHLRTTFGNSDSFETELLYMKFRRKSIRGKPIWIYNRNIDFFFANLLICDFRTETPGTKKVCVPIFGYGLIASKPTTKGCKK